MIDISTFFLIFGLVILIGFAGRMIRARTNVPESLFLIVFGLILGPVLGFVPKEVISDFVPIVSVAAMIAILVESGIEFDISKLRGSLRNAVIFTLLVAFLTTLLVSLFLWHFLGWGLGEAALLGLISSGTTTITAMSLLRGIDVSDKLRRLILLETIINDFTLILGTFLIVEVIKVSEVGVDEAAQLVFSEFSVAIVLGLIVAYLWRFILLRMYQKKELSYASTLGVCFVLYFLSDVLGGNSIIAIFTFSLFLGNYRRIFKFIKSPKSKDKEEDSDFSIILKSIHSVQADMTFFLASSFFVLLGLTFDPHLLEKISPWIIAGVIGIILIVRFLSSFSLSWMDKAFAPYRWLITIMIPRGYVAAVLAFVPAQEGIKLPLITDIIVVLIITTTMIAIGGTALIAWVKSRRKAK
jgi:NhaP-type Na+/H+ or K+/H+ antiporter